MQITLQWNINFKTSTGDVLVNIISSFLAPYKLYLTSGLIILCVVILGTHLYKDNATRSERDSAVMALKQYKDSQAQAVEAKNKEIAIIEQASKIQHENSQRQHEQEVARLNLNSYKIKKDLENEKGNIASLLNDSYQLRVKQASSDSSRVSEVSDATKLSAEGSGHLTITLTQAGQSCALDYQDLMNAWLDNCKLYGCK